VANTHELYTREIYNNLKYRGTWLPGAPIRLGSVGMMESGIFRPITDLAKLDISYQETKDTESDTLDFTSSSGVTITFKASGKAGPQFKALAEAEAGAVIEFSRVGAAVLQLRGVSLNRIDDQPQLGRAMLRSIAVGDDSKRWLRDWVVITEVARASRGTILVSETDNARLELKASGTVAPTSLADASANFVVATESGKTIRVLSEDGLTPLYRGLRLKKKFFFLYDEILPASSEVPPPNEVFGDLDPDEDDRS
jgi:hypothetical protein